MLKIDAVVDYGKWSAESCYILEGNFAIISRGSALFEMLEATIWAKYSLGKVHKISDKILELIMWSKILVSRKKRLTEVTCLAVFLELHKSKDVIKTLQSDKSSVLGSISQSGRMMKLTTRVGNEDNLEHTNNSIVEARV